MRPTDILFLVILVAAIFFRVHEFKKDQSISWAESFSIFAKTYGKFLIVILIAALIVLFYFKNPI